VKTRILLDGIAPLPPLTRGLQSPAQSGKRTEWLGVCRLVLTSDILLARGLQDAGKPLWGFVAHKDICRGKLQLEPTLLRNGNSCYNAKGAQPEGCRACSARIRAPYVWATQNAVCALAAARKIIEEDIESREELTMLHKAVIAALIVGLGSGVAIGFQGTLNSWSARIVGSVSTGLLVNITGGLVALMIAVAFTLSRSGVHWETIRPAAPFILASGVLGIAIISGIAFSLSRIGIAAGLSVVILGQMLIATLVDSLGWGSSEQIPFSVARMAGLVLLMSGTWLLLPRSQ